MPPIRTGPDRSRVLIVGAIAVVLAVIVGVLVGESTSNDGTDTAAVFPSAMIAEERKYQSSVLLLGMRVPPNYGSEYEQKFRSVYEDIAKSKRVALAPFLFEGFAENRAMFQPDGIHPTAAAQRPMLDTVWPHLQPLLVRPAVTTR